MATDTLARKNKRLSNTDRDTLYSFAKKQVAATEDSAALDAAYDAAAQVIHDLMIEKYPPKDMKVLERYGAAEADACIYVTRAQYDFDRFCFRDGDKRIPVRPRERGCNRGSPFILEGDHRQVYDAFKDAEKAQKDAMQKRLSDYRALIYGARNFNEVASVWPAAEALREAIVGTGTALQVLSDDVVARLRNDAAHVLAEAA